MIDLNDRHLKALDASAGEHPLLVDTKTGEEFVLVRRDAYERMRRQLDGMTRGAGWDDPALDDYEQFRKDA